MPPFDSQFRDEVIKVINGWFIDKLSPLFQEFDKRVGRVTRTVYGDDGVDSKERGVVRELDRQSLLLLIIAVATVVNTVAMVFLLIVTANKP